MLIEKAYKIWECKFENNQKTLSLHVNCKCSCSRFILRRRVFFSITKSPPLKTRELRYLVHRPLLLQALPRGNTLLRMCDVKRQNFSQYTNASSISEENGFIHKHLYPKKSLRFSSVLGSYCKPPCRDAWRLIWAAQLAVWPQDAVCNNNITRFQREYPLRLTFLECSRSPFCFQGFLVGRKVWRSY